MGLITTGVQLDGDAALGRVERDGASILAGFRSAIKIEIALGAEHVLVRGHSGAGQPRGPEARGGGQSSLKGLGHGAEIPLQPSSLGGGDGQGRRAAFGIESHQIGAGCRGGEGADGAGGVPAFFVMGKTQHPAQGHIDRQTDGEGGGYTFPPLRMTPGGGHQGGHDGRAGMGGTGLVNIVEIQRVGRRPKDQRLVFRIGRGKGVGGSIVSPGVKIDRFPRYRLAPAGENDRQGVFKGKPHMRQVANMAGEGLLDHSGQFGQEAAFRFGSGHRSSPFWAVAASARVWCPAGASLAGGSRKGPKRDSRVDPLNLEYCSHARLSQFLPVRQTALSRGFSHSPPTKFLILATPRLGLTRKHPAKAV